MKILILSCSTGEGHNSAAKALEEELINRGENVIFKDALSFCNKKTKKIIQDFFNNIALKTPSIFGAMYKAGDKISNTTIKSPIYFANSLYANKLGSYLNKNKIDIVICTHLFPMEAITYLKRKRQIKVKCYATLTDYTIIPFLEETELDGYFLPDETLVKKLSTKKVPKKIIHPFGIPISSKYLKKRTKKESRNLLNLPNNNKIIMIMTGGIGCGNICDMVDSILQNIKINIIILVLTGKNNKLKHKLDKKHNRNIITVGFTDKVPLYMDAADILLSKPGGLSSTEAAVKKIPLIHTMPIPGCETENANFFSKRGMSIKVTNLEELVSSINLLLNSPKKQETMLKKQEYINPNATSDIINYIINENSSK